MIRGFTRASDQQIQVRNGLDDLKKSLTSGDHLIWIDVEGSDSDALHFIKDRFSLNEEAIEDCLKGEQHPRIDEFDTYIFVVFYGMFGVEQHEEVEPRKLAAFLGQDFLITVHREPLRSVREIRERCVQFPDRVLGKGVDFTFYTIIDGMVDRFLSLAENYEDRIDKIEESILGEELDPDVFAKLLPLRCAITELRQMAVAQKDLINPIVKEEYEFVSETLAARFSHVRDHLTKTIRMMDALRDRLRGVQETYNVYLANQMNRTMKTLTTFASIMLPLSLMAGIYGMNVPLWPKGESYWSFVGILAAMALVSAGTLWYFKRRQIL